MRESLVFISALFLPLLHILIMQRWMTLFLGPGNRSFLGYAGWGIYFVFLCVANLGITFPPQFFLTGNIIFVFLIGTLTGRKGRRQRGIFSLLICSIWMLSEVIAVLVLSTVGTDIDTTSGVTSLISIISMLFFSIIMKPYINKKYYSEISLCDFLVILLIPIGSMYISHHIFLIATEHEEYRIFSVIVSLLFLLMHCTIFEICDWISRNAELRAQNRLYEQQLDMCGRQVEKQESLYLENERKQHDMKNHLASVLGMVQCGRFMEAEEYIQGMLDDGIGSHVREISRSGNIVVDALINHKYALARKDGIRFDINVFIPAALPFQGAHLTIILGNLLENALEACSKVTQEQRYISLEMSFVKEILQICIRNSCLLNQRKDNTGRYLTTKEDTVHHGIGLSSVEQAAACYHGEVVTQNMGNEFLATVVLYGTCEK